MNGHIVGQYGFVDTNQDGDLDCRRYSSVYVFNLLKGDISWMRKREFVVALSTTKVECMETTYV